MSFPTIGRFCCHFTLSFMLLAAEAHAQVERNSELDAQWSAVRALPVAELVQVRLLKNGTVRGSIVSSTETTLTVTTKSGEMTTARSDIKEVKVKGGELKKGIIGAAIGGAAGVGTAAILDGALTDGNGMSGSAAALLGAVGAGIGFASAFFRPSYRTIYKVR